MANSDLHIANSVVSVYLLGKFGNESFSSYTFGSLHAKFGPVHGKFGGERTFTWQIWQ